MYFCWTFLPPNIFMREKNPFNHVSLYSYSYVAHMPKYTCDAIITKNIENWSKSINITCTGTQIWNIYNIEPRLDIEY